MIDSHIAAHGKRLFGLCLKLCDSKDDAEDLYQETWLKAYKSYYRYDPSREFEGWLTAICVNAYRDMRRREKWLGLFARFSSGELKDVAMGRVAAIEEPPERREVRQAVDALPEKLRVAVTIYYFLGMNMAETARMLGIPEGTAKYRLHEARKILRREIDRGG